MLLQVPREPSNCETQHSTDGSAFEAGVRRDLAAASIVSYEPMLGGWRKRAFDLIVVVVTLPFWLTAMLIAILWSSFAIGGSVFSVDRCVGYGGRSFRRLHLRLTKPASEEPPPVSDEGESSQTLSEEVTQRAKWTRAFERLPQLLNVMRGDMSLVGPSALLQGNLDQLKSGRRHYLSARPGIFGINRLVDREHAESQFKAYTLSWSLMLDLLIIWDCVRGFRNRGRLWKPGLRLNKIVPGLALDRQREIEVIVRKRSAP
jgi:exopolysaccharide production protein ExoY